MRERFCWLQVMTSTLGTLLEEIKKNFNVPRPFAHSELFFSWDGRNLPIRKCRQRARGREQQASSNKTLFSLKEDFENCFILSSYTKTIKSWRKGINSFAHFVASDTYLFQINAPHVRKLVTVLFFNFFYYGQMVSKGHYGHVQVKYRRNCGSFFWSARTYQVICCSISFHLQKASR